MKILIPKGVSPKRVAKRAFFLAWSACGGPLGMGWLQNTPNAGEEDVWQNIQEAGDYPGRNPVESGKAYADYVFGRMMKLGLKFDRDSVTVQDNAPTRDYQAWCCRYTTYEALVEAALASILGEQK